MAPENHIQVKNGVLLSIFYLKKTSQDKDKFQTENFGTSHITSLKRFLTKQVLLRRLKLCRSSHIKITHKNIVFF